MIVGFYFNSGYFPNCETTDYCSIVTFLREDTLFGERFIDANQSVFSAFVELEKETDTLRRKNDIRPNDSVCWCQNDGGIHDIDYFLSGTTSVLYDFRIQFYNCQYPIKSKIQVFHGAYDYYSIYTSGFLRDTIPMGCFAGKFHFSTVTIHAFWGRYFDNEFTGSFDSITNSNLNDTITSGNYLIVYGYFNPNGGKIEEFNQNKIRVYPNPAADILTVESENILSSVEIYNSWFSLIKNIENLDSKNFRISVDYLPAGIYFLRIQDGDNNQYTSKIVTY